jgi:hypothetical protein
MGLRGPKPVDKERLEFQALQLANFLYTLRDGLGVVVKSSRPKGSFNVDGIAESSRKTRDFFQLKVDRKRIAFKFVPRIGPSPAAWEQLKRARTEKEIRHAAEQIRRWARRVERSDWRIEFPRLIRDHAKYLLNAKKAWNYPSGSRPKSDDKRVLFFAKALAGFMFDLSPGYIAKKLTYWNWPKEWVQGPFVAMEESFGDQIVDLSGRERKR